MNRRFYFIFFLILFAVSCKKAPTVRTYTEIVVESPAMAASPFPSESESSPVRWTSPESWQEKKGQGMRLATFLNTDAQNPIECSIIQLGGAAGGINDNIIRWMKQINMEIPEENKLNEFIGQQERLNITEKLSALIIDFSKLQPQAGNQSPSILAAIIEVSNAKIFIKITGTKAAIAANQNQFRQLVQSIRLEP